MAVGPFAMTSAIRVVPQIVMARFIVFSSRGRLGSKRPCLNSEVGSKASAMALSAYSSCQSTT
jgi:hypothetical protein